MGGINVKCIIPPLKMLYCVQIEYESGGCSMGLVKFFKGQDINEGLKEYQETEGAVLIDVREADEFAGGHIPESINIPLSRINLIESVVPDKETPLFVYCLSGARSSKAASQLKQKGYQKAVSIGGINSYKGTVER